MNTTYTHLFPHSFVAPFILEDSTPPSLQNISHPAVNTAYHTAIDFSRLRTQGRTCLHCIPRSWAVCMSYLYKWIEVPRVWQGKEHGLCHSFPCSFIPSCRFVSLGVDPRTFRIDDCDSAGKQVEN